MERFDFSENNTILDDILNSIRTSTGLDSRPTSETFIQLASNDFQSSQDFIPADLESTFPNPNTFDLCVYLNSPDATFEQGSNRVVELVDSYSYGNVERSDHNIPISNGVLLADVAVVQPIVNPPIFHDADLTRLVPMIPNFLQQQSYDPGSLAARAVTVPEASAEVVIDCTVAVQFDYDAPFVSESVGEYASSDPNTAAIDQEYSRSTSTVSDVPSSSCPSISSRSTTNRRTSGRNVNHTQAVSKNDRKRKQNSDKEAAPRKKRERKKKEIDKNSEQYKQLRDKNNVSVKQSREKKRNELDLIVTRSEYYKNRMEYYETLLIENGIPFETAAE